jgi:hypothetical protein
MDSQRAGAPAARIGLRSAGNHPFEEQEPGPTWTAEREHEIHELDKSRPLTAFVFAAQNDVKTPAALTVDIAVAGRDKYWGTDVSLGNDSREAL